jgi:hypothetical protein
MVLSDTLGRMVALHVAAFVLGLLAGQEAPFKEFATAFRDGEAPIDKDTPEFLRLLDHFRHGVTVEQLRTAALPQVTADAAYQQPARYRGEVLHVFGRLVKVYKERLTVTTPDPVDAVTLAILQEHPSKRTVWVYLPGSPATAEGKPVEFKTYRRGTEEFYDDWVEVEGVFLRRYLYPSQSEHVASAGVLFAKTLRVSRKPEVSDARAWLYLGVAGTCGVAIGTVLLAGLLSRRRRARSLPPRTPAVG